MHTTYLRMNPRYMVASLEIILEINEELHFKTEKKKNKKERT